MGEFVGTGFGNLHGGENHYSPQEPTLIDRIRCKEARDINSELRKLEKAQTEDRKKLKEISDKKSLTAKTLVIIIVVRRHDIAALNRCLYMLYWKKKL